MKTNLPLVIAGLCGLLASTALTARDQTASAPPPPPAAGAPPTATPAPTANKTPIAPDTSPATPLSTALADSKALEAADRAHVLPPPDPFLIATPPPPLRPETKTPPPVGTYVWMPGHWTPVEGEWKWVAGEWGVPATPSSVWIQGRYDLAARRWSAGYWQPDRVQTPEPPTPAKEVPPVGK